MEEDRIAFNGSRDHPTENTHLGTRKWEDHIRLDLKEIDANMMNWIGFIGEAL